MLVRVTLDIDSGVLEELLEIAKAQRVSVSDLVSKVLAKEVGLFRFDEDDFNEKT